MMSMNRQQLISPNQRHGHEWDTGADRYVGWSFHERLHLAIFGTPAFGEDEKWHAVFECTDRTVESCNRTAFLVNRDLARTMQMPSDERPLPQALLSQDSELKRQATKDQWCIHERGVV